MMHCRFEDRIAGQARVMRGLRERITANTPEELAEAFDRIEHARLAGGWIALMLDYELGEWLEPALVQTFNMQNPVQKQTPRLTALVFDSMQIEKPWENTTSDHACITTITPELSKSTYCERIEKFTTGSSKVRCIKSMQLFH